MKNLTGSLIQLPPELNTANDEIRFIKTDWGSTKETLSSQRCAICDERLWVEDKGLTCVLQEAFGIMDPRAYIGGLPDYIKISHCLLQCHYICKDELQKRLDAGIYLQ